MSKKFSVTRTYEIVGRLRTHSKASEVYQDVVFSYGNMKWEGSIPTTYRRANLELSSVAQIQEHIENAYDHCDPKVRKPWLDRQNDFWSTKPKAKVTKKFFDSLLSFHWCCVACDFPTNPNWARRIQDIKDFGYTLSTDTARHCSRCKKNRTHLLLVPFPRAAEMRYENWSKALRKKIIDLLGSLDVYENRKASHLLPDHKFPEIRWDTATPRLDIESLTADQIKKDFQLLTNQRNQQKREVCRACFQTGQRGMVFGIAYFYKGDATWPQDVPRTGKEAEHGCEGCGWYDFRAWRDAICAKVRE